MLKLNKHITAKSKPKQRVNLTVVHVCVFVSLCATAVHNIAQNSSDYFPS